MKKIIIIIALLFALMVFILLFKKDEKEEKIVVSEVTHSVFYTPWYVAIEKGYFKEEGLDIEVMLTPGADKVATSVLSGDSQIGFSGPEATIYVYNNSKQKLISFASLTKRDGQFIFGPCELKDKFNVTDFTNKVVLAGRSGGMPLLMFKYALKESNYDENNLIIDSSVDFASLSSAYISKQGAFVNLFEPNALKLEKENYGCVLASLGNISGVVPYTTFYAKEEYINNNKDSIRKFNKALNKGIKFTKENTYEKIANTIKSQFTDLSIEDLTEIVRRYKDADSWYESTYMNIDDYNRLQDIMIYGKVLDKKVDANNLITNEFN